MFARRARSMLEIESDGDEMMKWDRRVEIEIIINKTSTLSGSLLELFCWDSLDVGCVHCFENNIINIIESA
jgi:hypothetical protein